MDIVSRAIFILIAIVIVAVVTLNLVVPRLRSIVGDMQSRSYLRMVSNER